MRDADQETVRPLEHALNSSPSVRVNEEPIPIRLSRSERLIDAETSMNTKRVRRLHAEYVLARLEMDSQTFSGLKGRNALTVHKEVKEAQRCERASIADDNDRRTLQAGLANVSMDLRFRDQPLLAVGRRCGSAAEHQ